MSKVLFGVHGSPRSTVILQQPFSLFNDLLFPSCIRQANNLQLISLSVLHSAFEVGLGIIVRYKGPEFFIGLGRRASHSSKSRTESLSPPLVDHICWGRAPGFCFLTCLVWFLLDFLRTEIFVTICHLENRKIFNVRFYNGLVAL